jgi:hypothetical protein
VSFAPFLLLYQELGSKLLKIGEILSLSIDAVDAYVLYFQSTVDFPSWTSRVRVPSPAPVFQSHSDLLPIGVPLLMGTPQKAFAAKTLISKRSRPMNASGPRWHSIANGVHGPPFGFDFRMGNGALFLHRIVEG